MDRKEAKEILLRYRPGTKLRDPQIGEALELAQRDPQLAEWLAKHYAQAANTDPSAPNQPAAAADADASRERVTPLSKPVLIVVGVAVAALLASLLWPFFAEPKPMDQFTNYRDHMARIVQRTYPMKMLATEQWQVRDYFRTNAGPVDFTLPHNLEKLPAKGAAVLTWNSNPVALMGLDGGTNTVLYLFFIPRSAFLNVPITESPSFARVGHLMTASWTAGNEVYVLAGPDDETALKNYLE